MRAGVRQVKRLLARPPFLARNSALVEQAAAAHTLPLLPAPHLRSLVSTRLKTAVSHSRRITILSEMNESLPAQ